jgi:cellulose synthase (UDP-forming)
LIVCIEQPRKRKAERFDRNEPILLRQSGKSHLARLADVSITGARLIDPDPPAIGSAIECRIYGRSIAAIVVRRTRNGFAVRFEEGMDTRVHAIRAFYAGEYVRAYQGIRALPVGKALLLRLFG